MAADVGPAYRGWEHDESQDVSFSDHGSASFGSFKFESLEWEKRSVFTRNKCQEELEKFRSPGLVAQKKAYFEEYYKKIRDEKAMKENQHTKMELHYGDDDNISNQSGKDETGEHAESLGDKISIVIDAPLTKVSLDVALEKHNFEDSQIQHINLEPASSTLHSSREACQELNKETSNVCAPQMRHFDSGSTMPESLLRTEEIELHDHVNFDHIVISRKPAELIGKQKKDSDCHVHNHHRDRHPSLIKTEFVEPHQPSGRGEKDISRTHCNLESNIGPDLAAAVTVLHPANLDAVKSDSNTVQEKANPHAGKYKDNIPVTKITRPGASIKNGLKVELKSQRNTSQPPKYHFQKIVGKRDNNVGSSNPTSDRVLRNNISISVASYKPLTDACSKVAVPCQFSLGTERRTTDDAPNLQVHDTSRNAARTGSLKRKASEHKRASEQVLERTLPTSRMGRLANIPEPLKDQKTKGSENRGSEQVRGRTIPTSHTGRVANISGPPKDQKSKGNKRSSEQVQERTLRARPMMTRVANILEPSKARGSEQVRERTLPAGPMVTRVTNIPEPPKARGTEQVRERTLPAGPMVTRVANIPEPPKARGFEQVRERTLPAGPMVTRVANIPEPPKARGSEQVRERTLPTGPMVTRVVNIPEPLKARHSEQVRERTLPAGHVVIPEPPKARYSEQVRERTLPAGHVVIPEPPKARISRSVNVPAPNHSYQHIASEFRSTIALRKDEPKEASSRTEPLSHKVRRPLSACRSHNGTMPRQETKPWR